MGSLVPIHKIMIHLWFVAWMSLSVCNAQFSYDTNNCTSNESGPATRFSCKSTQDSCKTFLVYRAKENFNTISKISELFNKNSNEVLPINNFTTSSVSQVLKQGKEVLIPVNCSCSGEYYQANLSYKVIENTTYSEIACDVFEGLLKHLTLAEENLSQGNNPKAGSELHVPFICACPDSVNLTKSMSVNYLVTYPFIPDDDPDKVSVKFGIRPEEIYAVNNINSWTTVYPETVFLVPLKDGPIRIHDIADTPPPPGFLPTSPQLNTEESPSNLYVAGPVIGFILFIALLASGFYMKKFRRSDVVHSLNSTNFSNLSTSTRTSHISTQTNKSSTPWCLSPDLLLGIKYCLRNYNIADLRKATNNFSEENKICRNQGCDGDFVYKGFVDDLEVMIKRMKLEDTQKVIDLHSRINHINIVNLLGVCYGESNNDSWSYLVFEYPKNGCLKDCLSDPYNPLNWYKRTQIAFDIATCLYYLHYCSFPSYAHMNVSSRNIFITANWRGKLADVGRALATSSTPYKRNDGMEIESKGLVAPEYISHGSVSDKVDIFAFGVMLLELISGGNNFDGKTIKDSLGFLLGEASEGGCFERLRSFMDPNLKDYAIPEALCLAFLAKDCVADDPLHRPTMDDIMKVLSKMV